MSDTACKKKWTRTYLSELVFEMSTPTLTDGDNTCVNSWVSISSNLKCSNHIDIHTHFIRNTVLSGHVSVRHVNSDDNEADGFT